MPKIRALHPSFFTDDDVVETSPLARLLFQGLWCYACDNGHVEDKPRQLKLRILPADDTNVPALLDEIEAAGLIVRGGGWITVPNLTTHQRTDKRYFTTCDYPGCRDAEAAAHAAAAPRFGNHRRWHEGRGIVDPTCEFCPTPPDVTPSGPHRVHDVTPSGARRVPIADGDGDGDGDGDEVVTSVGADSAPRKRGRRLPDDFVPSEGSRQAILEEAPTLDLRREHARFVDHWTAQPGQRGVKADWDATWRNWMRRAADDARRNGTNGKSRRQQETDDLFARAMARAQAADAAEAAGLTIRGEIIA